MRESVSRMVMAATVAAIGLAACTDVTPWAYPTEPETAQRAVPVATAPLPEPQPAPPAYTAPRVIAAAPAPVAPPPPAVTYAPPRTVVAPPPVVAAPAPAVTYAPPRAVAAPARPVVGAAPPVTVAAAQPRVVVQPRVTQPAPAAPARAAPVVVAQAPAVVVSAPAATTVYVPAQPMLTEKSGLIDFVLTDASGRPEGAILKDKTVIRFSPALAAAMDPDRSRLAPGRPLVVRGTVSGGRRNPGLQAVEMGTDIYSMVTLGY
jgi:hypothetical protein